MNIEDLKNNVNSLINLSPNDVSSAYLYAFKSSPNDVEHPYASLKYVSYDTLLPKLDVLDNMKFIMKSFKKKYLDKDTTFESYCITNSKDVVDYFERANYDFTDPQIINGTANGLDSSKYKVEYFLDSINKCSNIARNKATYRGLKYSLLKVTTNDLGNVYILNKTNPLYKPKNIMYSFVEGDKEDEKPSINKISPLIFRLPTFPSMIIFNDLCFFISNEIEAVFGFEQFNKSECTLHIDNLKNSLTLNDFSSNLFEKMKNKKKYYNLFSDFDPSKLNKLISKDANTINFLINELKLPIDNNLNCNLSTENQADLLIWFITNSLKKDPIENGKYVFVRNSKPITIDNPQ